MMQQDEKRAYNAGYEDCQRDVQPKLDARDTVVESLRLLGQRRLDDRAKQATTIKALVEALSDMVEHFATPPNDRMPGSYNKSNRQVAAEARAALALAKEQP